MDKYTIFCQDFLKNYINTIDIIKNLTLGDIILDFKNEVITKEETKIRIMERLISLINAMYIVVEDTNITLMRECRELISKKYSDKYMELLRNSMENTSKLRPYYKNEIVNGNDEDAKLIINSIIDQLVSVIYQNFYDVNYLLSTDRIKSNKSDLLYFSQQEELTKQYIESALHLKDQYKFGMC